MRQLISNFVTIIAAWQWNLGIFITLITWFLTITAIVHYNRRPERHRRALKRLGKAYFLVPSSLHHGCDFAKQTDDEHWLKQIYLPSESDVVLDFIVIPRIEMDTSQVYLG